MNPLISNINVDANINVNTNVNTNVNILINKFSYPLYISVSSSYNFLFFMNTNALIDI